MLGISLRLRGSRGFGRHAAAGRGWLRPPWLFIARGAPAVNITCVIHGLRGGGAERVMAALASRLVERQHQVCLITLDAGVGSNYPLDPRVTRVGLNMMQVSRGPISGALHTWRRVRALRSALAAADGDVVLSFGDRTNILTLLAARPLSVPVVISERSDPAQQTLGRYWEGQRSRTYPCAAAIIALTLPAAEYLRQRSGGRTEVLVIPSAVDIPAERSDRQAAGARRRILGVGRLETEKGFDRLLVALSDLRVRAPAAVQDWTLRIAGEGSQRSALEQQIRQLQLTNVVTLPGWIDPIGEELAAATLFVLPSRYEGFPSALLEALAAGVPCLATDCPSGPAAVVGDSGAALLVANHTAALADGLLHLIQDADAREALGRRGLEAARRFPWSAMVEAYEAVLHRAAMRTSG